MANNQSYELNGAINLAIRTMRGLLAVLENAVERAGDARKADMNVRDEVERLQKQLEAIREKKNRRKTRTIRQPRKGYHLWVRAADQDKGVNRYCYVCSKCQVKAFSYSVINCQNVAEFELTDGSIMTFADILKQGRPKCANQNEAAAATT